VDIPFRHPGKQSCEQKAREGRFADELIGLAESLDFKMSARGWCYHLEEHGLSKADFDKAEALINSLREEGVLPIDLVATSQQRIVEGLENISSYKTANAFAEYLRDVLIPLRASIWTPESQWRTQSTYVELVVEKIDLVGLFSPVCEEFGVTVTNMQGWSDPLTRATQMRRFVLHRDAGRPCRVLYVTDHDPDGLRIAELLQKHYDNLANARWMDGSQIDWTADSVVVERVGLDYDMIENLGLTWIDGLTTGRRNHDGSKRDLADPTHKNHKHPYVQDYLSRFGARKVEANALVARIDEAREWLRGLLPRYIDLVELGRYRRDLNRQREDFLNRVRLTLRTPR
jgi:hypothetical protein